MIVFGLTLVVFTILIGVPAHAQNAQYAQSHIVFPSDAPVQCPALNCPPWCQRFRGQNGCVYCGPCNVNYNMCPPVKCPARVDVKCGLVVGRNGCKQCVCQHRRQQNVQTIQPVYNSPPNHPQHQQPQAPNCPTPQCSSNCQVVYDQRGCGHCKCHPPVCQPFSCPPNCSKYPGIDGCPQCDCGESAACPTIPCDLNRCRHVVDGVSGCAVSCECNNIPIMSQQGYGK